MILWRGCLALSVLVGTISFAYPSETPYEEKERGTGKKIVASVSLKEWQERAEKGDAEAQVYLGVSYFYGLGLQKDDQKAFSFLTLASHQKHPFADFHLYWCYEEGLGVPKDTRKAEFLNTRVWNAKKGDTDSFGASFSLLKQAAREGHAIAQNTLGSCYYWERGVPKDEKEALRLYRLAAAQGHAPAQNNLGMCYYVGSEVPQDEREAVRFYRLAADQGHVTAQNNLGYCYYHGHGVLKDKKEGVRLYKLAAYQGNIAAQHSLGVCYEYGRGVERDFKKAVQLYRLAADQEDARGQYHLGSCYHYGQGVPKDEKEAVRLYHLAASHGYAPAYMNLLQMCQRVANQGDAHAQYVLGWLYDENKIGGKDRLSSTEGQALEWYQRAADQGHKEAGRVLGRK